MTDPEVLKLIPEEAHGKVYQCDLKKAGITDYGKLTILDGCYKPESTVELECFCNGKRLQLARWPKEGFVRPESLVEPGVFGGSPSILKYDSPRHERWTTAEDLWLFGYFRWLWADSTVSVSAIDPEKKHLIISPAYVTHEGSMSDTQGIIYYAFNLLEELSEPGEWYLRRSTGMLYFIPTCPIEDVVLEIGMLNKCVIQAEKSVNITIKDLDFDLGRYDAINVNNCINFKIIGCRISRYAGRGIHIKDGSCCIVADSALCDTGRGCVDVTGGDRETLTPGGHEIINNHLHDSGKLVHTYTPHIKMYGCGNRIAYNTMYNCPSSAIRIDGNEMVVEYNDIHSVVLESDDQGATDTFNNPTYRGLVFRYNYIHDVGKRFAEKEVCGAAGIRLDDAISEVQIYGNIFERCSNGHFGAVQINSGRDNMICGNLFIDCKAPYSGGWSPVNSVYQRMLQGCKSAEFFFNDLYMERYPKLKILLDNNGMNYINDNIFCCCGTNDVEKTAYVKGHTESKGNLVIKEKDVTIEEAMARGEKEIGFKRIDMDRIGSQYHAGCRWKNEKVLPESSPIDWKGGVELITISGDSVMSDEWTTFGVFSEFDQVLSAEELSTIPEYLEMNGEKVLPKKITVENGSYDLKQIYGNLGVKDALWIFIPLETSGGINSIGVGFDWWGTVWIDGKEIFTTGNEEKGNGKSPVAVSNHIVDVDLSPGKHVVAVRLLSGASEARLAIAGARFLRKEWNEKYWWLVQ